VLWSLVYRALCAVLELIILGLRSSDGKELEILVPRHGLAIARRSAGMSAADRALLAALSRSLPTTCAVCLLDHPEDASALASSSARAPAELPAASA
jgi:hypothetical protein